MSTWCRACGQPHEAQTGTCPACGFDLAIESPAPTPIGLVFATRSKLGVGKKLGVCLETDGDSLLLHFSAKDKEPGRVPFGTAATDLTPTNLSPATRLLYAANLTDPKLSWDKDTLRKRVAELCSDVRVRRRVVDEALGLHWPEIVEWVSLPASEKAWRSAHHAAMIGDVAALREALQQLPPSGYPTRADLLLPFLGVIRQQALQWRPVINSILGAQVARGPDIAATVMGELEHALVSGANLLPANRQAGWESIRQHLVAESAIDPPTAPSTPAWLAASLLSAADRSIPLDAAVNDLLSLEPALLDDLIDERRISGASALGSQGGVARLYLLARLDSVRLSDDDLRRVGHTAELARRLFLSRDRASLSGLESDPRVEHYQALLDVVEGGRPDDRRLDPATVAQLALPTGIHDKVKEGLARTLPAPLPNDPSLWPMFAEQAKDGKLLADTNEPLDHPLTTWIGLQRLIGLLWSGQFGEAVEHGQLLIGHLRDERRRDEALNLTAFALAQLGRFDESLRHLEAALAGDYTENLLVNVSIIASKVSPEIGVRHLARLVEQAPPELQRAGLYQAIGVWQSTEQPFPTVLIPALRAALSTPQPIEDFLQFAEVAIGEAPDLLLALPRPGGELDGPYWIVQARARFKNDKNFLFVDLADAFIGVYRSIGRPDWFTTIWDRWVKDIHDSVFVEFGDAPGSAEFIDKVLVEAPELFPDTERFVLAPQAGAHLAASVAKRSSTLNDRAWRKFFFDPVEEFFTKRAQLPESTAAYLAENFTRCLIYAGFKTLGVERDDVAARYNPLVERQRWDQQNLHAIISQKLRILDEAESGPIATLSQVVDRLQRLGSDADGVREATRELASETEAWRREINSLRGNG